MSWFQKIMPPKINKKQQEGGGNIPEGLWAKCPSCQSILYRKDLERNLQVCPKCDHHLRVNARQRLDYFLDAEGREGVRQPVYDRMEKERNAVAQRFRAEGREEAQRIRAEANREVEEILAQAYREAQSIRGEGDAEAAKIYAKAYREDPEFYSFYRSLLAYENSFEGGRDSLVLEPDSEFFDYFGSPGGRGGGE